MGGPAPAAFVFLPPDHLFRHLAADVSIIAMGSLGVVVAGDEGLVAALYDAGARLVLPAGLAGCLGLAA